MEKPKKRPNPNKSKEQKTRIEHMADDFGTPAQDPLRPMKEELDRRKVFPKVQDTSYLDTRRQEEEMVDALDDLKALKRLGPLALKLQKKKMSVDQAIKEVSNDSFLMLMKLAFTQGNPKVQADVLKHMLALAGFNPAQKHQVERVDTNATREQLLAIIAGAEGDLKKENIRIIDDRLDSELKDDLEAIKKQEEERKSRMAEEGEDYDYRDYEV